MNSNKVKGFNDFTGEEALKRREIRRIILETFESYGFEPAETPIVEYEEFVRGDKNQENDDAVREIFTLKDRGKRNLALRYEFTFQLERLMQNKKLPYKRYQIGELFRDESIREGRTRQFTQCDIDIIGSTIKDEAECLATFDDIFKKLNIGVTIYINNRKLLNEILDDLKLEKSREQILREIDKMDKLSEKEIKSNLKKLGAEKILEILKQKESFFEKYSSYSEIRELKKYCKFFGVKIVFRPFLVRGLSYYNGSVFEVWSKKINVAVCGGGSYLVNDIQSTGISFGFEPIMLLSGKFKIELEKFLVISLDKDKDAITLAQKLRKKGKNVSLFYGKPSKALEYANSYNIGKVIFIGEKEVKSKNFKVKDMKTGKEEVLKI
ncbi:hypothetical protein COU59_03340 [Candidatus Pacearchaeota archaeon CG10_big_fil_rev_8_21_14_0_10_34_12]|nr:MAG: hypothetical protein COU59_03340 [Candidatus Pacearchaeota archaeon CG10_big_fil_rev_8_21_14_0_10_34_12]